MGPNYRHPPFEANVRDYKFRSFTRETISRWPSVRAVKKMDFPVQENADVMFNSACCSSLLCCVNRQNRLLKMPQYCEEYTEAHRLLKFLKYFVPIHAHEIPPTSLLREFLGGSSFKY